MTIRFWLPGTQSIGEIDLEISSKEILVETPKYKLILDLPEEVEDAKAFARYDPKQCELRIRA